MRTLFSMQIIFFRFQRKSLEPHFQWQYTLIIFLFNTFFSYVNNKKSFSNRYDPLNKLFWRPFVHRSVCIWQHAPQSHLATGPGPVDFACSLLIQRFSFPLPSPAPHVWHTIITPLWRHIIILFRLLSKVLTALLHITFRFKGQIKIQNKNMIVSIIAYFSDFCPSVRCTTKLFDAYSVLGYTSLCLTETVFAQPLLIWRTQCWVCISLCLTYTLLGVHQPLFNVHSVGCASAFVWCTLKGAHVNEQLWVQVT